MLKSIRHLDYVVLICDNLASMKHFYHQIMGFEIHLETASWIELRIGSSLLALSSRDRPYVGEAIPEDSAAVQLAFRVAPHELDGCYEELQAHDVEIVQPPQLISTRVRQYWQHRTLFFKDPEGNLLEIYAEVMISSEDS